MNENASIQEFIKRAKEAGTPEQTIVGMLTVRGWPEKEVYEALASHYEQQVGMPIPHRVGSGTAAKDAFFYLLIFSTLATWTIGLGALAFTRNIKRRPLLRYVVSVWKITPTEKERLYESREVYRHGRS